MACTEVVQVVDVEVTKDQTAEIVITLFSGLILAAIIVAIILIIIFRKYIIKKCTCKCGGSICCFCCFGSVDDKDENSTAYLIHSWDEPGQEPGAAGDQSMTQLDDYETEPLISGRTSEFSLSSHSLAQLQGQDMIYANPGALEKPSNDDVFVETSFTDDQYESTEGTSFSFIDVFVAPRGKQHHVLYCCEKQSILKTEMDFHQHWTDFFLFLVETAASKLVAENQASEKWKADMLASFKKSITSAQKEHVSVLAVNIEQGQEENGKSSTDMLECAINGVTTQLLDTICSNLKETSITPDEAEKIATELKENLEKFEKHFFDVYLKDIEKLKNRIHLKEALMEKFLNDTDELIKEMNSHQKKHVKILEKVQMGSRVQLSDKASQIQDRLAPEVEELWVSVIKSFESAFNEQKMILKNDADSRVDKIGPKEKFDAAIETLKAKLASGKKTMPKFIESYCSKIRKLQESEAKSDSIEINFTATELNALIEMLGGKFLKKGVKEETAVYTEFTRSSGWVAPDLVNMIAQLNADLGDLQESLRSMRQKQETGLRALLNSPLSSASQNREYFGDLKLDEEFIQKMLEVQVDLSDTEKEALANKVAVETKCYKIHAEMNKLSQERRLKYDVGGKMARLHAKKEALSLENMAVDSNIKAMVGLNLEEQNIETTHKEAVESVKSKLSESLMSARKSIEVFFQIEIEKIRRYHEKNVDILGDEEKALNTLKSKLLERIPSSSERDRLLKEHQININVLDEEIQRSRRHQEQVLQQKIQARKLEKMEEDKRSKQQNVSQSLYTVGSANRFAANCLVSLLMEVRHKRSLKELEEYHAQEGEKLKAQLKRRYEINTKHSLQFHEKELIVKLAAALNMSRSDLEKELQVSMREEETGSDVQLLTQSILGSYDKAVLESSAH